MMKRSLLCFIILLLNYAIKHYVITAGRRMHDEDKQHNKKLGSFCLRYHFVLCYA